MNSKKRTTRSGARRRVGPCEARLRKSMAKARRLTEVMNVLESLDHLDADSVLKNPLVTDFLAKSQMSSIHLACHMRNLQLVTALLEHGENPNSKDGDGTYPIHLLCSNVQYSFLNGKMLETLLKYNANIDVQDSDGRTALMIASSGSLVSMVKALIQAGCDVNVCDKRGQTACHMSCHFASLGWYFWNTDCDNDQSGCLPKNNFPSYIICQTLLKAGADPKQATILPSAILYGSDEIVKELIDLGVDVNVMDGNRWSPLGCACSTPSISTATVKMLLEKGAKVNGFCRKGKPIVLAFSHNSVDKIKLLLSYGATLTTEEMSELVSLSMRKLFLENPEVIDENSDELLSLKLLQKAGFKTHREYKLKLMNLRSTDIKVGTVIDKVVFPVNSLSDICRVSIRSKLCPCIDDNVKCLPLPDRLKRFLQYEDF